MPSIYRPLAASFVILLLSSFLATAFAATAINLGTAGKFAVLARSEITLGSSATVNGDVGLSPGRSYSLDFPVLHLPLTGFGTSSLINGKVFASDYLGSVAILAQAASDSSAAFNAAFAQASSASDTSKMTLGAGALSGSYTPGLYNSASDITFKEITLVGGANDVFIFRTSGSISCSSSAKVILSGGVQTKNVFWIANEDITVASKAVFQGIMLSRGDISLGASAVVTGNAYAQGSISISSKAVLMGFTLSSPIVVVTPSSTSVSASASATDIPLFTASSEPIKVVVTSTAEVTTSAPLATATQALVVTATVTKTVYTTEISATTVTLPGSIETSVVTLPGGTVSETLTVQAPIETAFVTATADGVRTTVVSLVTETSSVELPASTVTETFMATQTLPAPTETVTATATSLVQLPAATETVTLTETQRSTIELAAPATTTVAESISIRTIFRPVTTVIQPVTVTWRQNVIQTTTSTVVWHVFDATTAAGAARTATPSIVKRSGAKRVAAWE